MEITYVMFGYDQDWNAFAASSVTASQARGIAESMELHGYHMAPSRGEAYPNAKCGSYLANEGGHPREFFVVNSKDWEVSSDKTQDRIEALLPIDHFSNHTSPPWINP